MRKKIVAGNWKMNKNLQEGLALANELNDVLKADKPNCDVVICTPFIHLAKVSDVIDHTIIGLGAENCADKKSGAYTGEVSAEMVKSTGAEYVILGHSERREYYHETPEILKEKVLLALENGLKVIFCIGETEKERDENKQNEVVKAELEGSVFNLSAEEFKNIVIAYEPIWAIRVRPLPATKPRRFTPTSAQSLLKSMVRLWQTKPASSMVAHARHPTLPNCLQSPTSMAASSVAHRSRQQTSRASSTPGNKTYIHRQ